MKRNKKVILLIAVIAVGMMTAWAVEKILNPVSEDVFTISREQQHEKAMEDGANPELGITEIPADGVVDKSFESHLPLIVIDVGEEEIPVTKSYIENEDGTVDVLRTGEEPFVTGSIQIIDNEDYHNSLQDEATQESKMKIRYRGNSSLTYDKKQYAIKLVNEDGSNRKMSVMSMGENNDWILNISMVDASLIRNYMAYNLGSAMFPYTPEAKYCEVFFKDGEEYIYQGLYLMMEKIEKSDERVDIATYEPGDDVVSYLLCRDRVDETQVQLSTYCSENNLCYGGISVLYPDAEVLDDYALEYIENDIDQIERVLYSEDEAVFATWTNYLDYQSFVDYFLINELFGNYDAGNNSTYFYRDGTEKLHMGPLWDYDGAMDNYVTELNNPEYVIFQNHPWFEKLCQSEEYVEGLQVRYKQMKDSIYSAESMGDYVDEVSAFLGNAAARDWSRWQSKYGENSALYVQEDEQGYVIDRKRSTYEEEVQRLKDFFTIKEQYMEDGLKELDANVIDSKIRVGSYAAVITIIALICSVVLIRRRNTFK